MLCWDSSCFLKKFTPYQLRINPGYTTNWGPVSKFSQKTFEGVGPVGVGKNSSDGLLCNAIIFDTFGQ